VCQQVDGEVDRNLKGRDERPRPRVRHVVGPVEAARQEVSGVPRLPASFPINFLDGSNDTASPPVPW
jgi:hypothetical protein